MAELEVIWDTVAKQAGTVAGIQASYGSGAGGVAKADGSLIQGTPEDYSEWPVVEVIYDGSEITPGNWETTVHRFAARVWMSRADSATAIQTLGTMLGRFRASFRSNYDLDGTCKQAVVVGSTGIVPDTINLKPFIYIDILLEVKVEQPATYSP